MGRKPKLLDFGGHSYPRRRKSERTVSKSIMSFRCFNCQTVRYVQLRELGRAARPRCLACGGPIEETTASHERTLEKLGALQEAKTGLILPKSSRYYKKCLSCGTNYADVASMSMHLKINSSCRDKYICEGWWGEYQGYEVLRGTGDPFEVIFGDWRVKLLTIEGEFVSVKVRGKGKAVIRKINSLETPVNK